MSINTETTIREWEERSLVRYDNASPSAIDLIDMEAILPVTADEVIIEDFNLYFGTGTKKTRAKDIRAMNKMVKGLGFKKIMWNKPIRQESCEEELTLYINPSYDGVGYEERSSGRRSNRTFYNYLYGLRRSCIQSNYYSIKAGEMDDQKRIMVEHGGEKFEFGWYLPKRNIVILDYTISPDYVYMDKGYYVCQIMEYIKQAVESYKIKGEDTSNFLKELVLTAFTKSLSENLISQKRNLRGTIESIKTYHDALIEKYRDEKSCKQTIEALGGMIENAQESIHKQVKEIQELKFVQSAELTNEGVKIIFEKIFIEVQGEDIEMGVYEASLLPTRLKIINQTPVDNGGSIYHSCHISGENICFGESQSMAYRLLGQMDFKKMAHFLYLYLKSYNPEDTYLDMLSWIKAKKNGGVVPNGS